MSRRQIGGYIIYFAVGYLIYKIGEGDKYNECRKCARRYPKEDQSDRVGYRISSLPPIDIRTHADEKEYQKTRDRYKWVPNGLLGVSLVLSGGAAGLSGWSAYETTRQADIADNAQRPWLKIIGMSKIVVSFDKQSIHTSYNLAISNVGNDPAVEIVAYADEPRMYLREAVPVDYLKQFCDRRSGEVMHVAIGSTVFPHDKSEVGAESGRPMAEIVKNVEDEVSLIKQDEMQHGKSEGRAGAVASLANYVAFVVGGCVVYQSSAQKPSRKYYTSYAFVVTLGPVPAGASIEGNGLDIRRMSVYSDELRGTALDSVTYTR